REALADPLVPLANLGGLWDRYKTVWSEERDAKATRQLVSEIERRDRRVLRGLGDEVPATSLEVVRKALAADSQRYRKTAGKALVLSDAPDPILIEPQIETATRRYKSALEHLTIARARLADLERKVATIPHGEQLADMLAELELKASTQSRAEAQLASIQQQLADHQSNRAHIKTRLEASRLRMSRDFQGQALDVKAIA